MQYIDLTERQTAVLVYIKQAIEQKGYPPSVREIGQALGLNSPSSVHSHLSSLEQKGYIKRDQSKPRALEIIQPNNTGDFNSVPLPTSNREMVDIPILGNVAAGIPIFADENLEDVFPVPLDYLHSNKSLFMLRVSGESMIEAGILHGDLIIVEQTNTAQNGQIVVALIDNEATVKTFYKRADHICLQPENSSMEPIIVKNVEILGRVIGLFRRF